MGNFYSIFFIGEIIHKPSELRLLNSVIQGNISKKQLLITSNEWLFKFKVLLSKIETWKPKSMNLSIQIFKCIKYLQILSLFFYEKKENIYIVR